MGSKPSEISNSLSQKYQALHDAFNALAVDAAQYQNSLSLTEKAHRGLFNSLSRIVAFSDHVHVALNLMAEDVRAIESTYGEPAAASGWTEMDDCFDEWFTRMGAANAKVH
jgi:hypothetical protein